MAIDVIDVPLRLNTEPREAFFATRYKNMFQDCTPVFPDVRKQIQFESNEEDCVRSLQRGPRQILNYSGSSNSRK